MPAWTAKSDGTFQYQWTSLDDFLQWVNQVVAPAAVQYGYKLVLEPRPKDEVMVDRDSA